MFYVSKSYPNNKWGITDTDDGIEEICSIKQISNFVHLGIEINGVVYNSIKNMFTVSVWQEFNNKLMVKNKLLTGTLTGMKGFNMRVENDDVIAMPPTTVFWDNLLLSAKDKFVTLIIPSNVTIIGDNFCENLVTVTDSQMISIIIVLCNNVKSVGSDAFSHWRISQVIFKHIIDFAGTDSFSTSLECKSTKDLVLPLRSISRYAIEMPSNKERLVLRGTEVLDNTCFKSRVSYSTGAKKLVKLICDNDIKKISTPFNLISRDKEDIKAGWLDGSRTSGGHVTVLKNFPKGDLYKHAKVIFIPYNVGRVDFDFSCANTLYTDYSNGGVYTYCNYVVILPRHLLQYTTNLRINENVVFSTLAYADEQEGNYYIQNIDKWMFNHKEYLDTVYSEHDLGHIIRLKLK